MKNKPSRTGGWIQTYSGKKFYPLDPRKEEVDPADIAHALSLTCRYNGHCRDFYSVAEHSVLVSRYVHPENAFLGLMHDASEAYISDLTSPVKAFMDDYKEIENNLQKVIRERFDLPCCPLESSSENLNLIDKSIVIDEAIILLRTPPEIWYDIKKRLNVKINCWRPKQAEREFLKRFIELYGDAWYD